MIKQVHEGSPTDNVIVELIDTVSSTAISTPTRLIRNVNSSSELEDIVASRVSMEESEVVNIFSYDSDDDDDDYDVAQDTVIGICSVKAKTDFLENFEVPSLSDISENDSFEIFDNFKSKLSPVLPGNVDPGKFVDPLTGLSMTSSNSETTESSKEIAVVSTSSSVSEDIIDFYEPIDFTIDSTLEDGDIFPQFETNFDLTNNMSELWDTHTTVKMKEVGKQIAREFLSDIIKVWSILLRI